MAKKFLALTIILMLASGLGAIASPFHAELDTALVTNIRLNDASISNTLRLGAKGQGYSLDVAIAYNPENSNSYNQIKGVGPSFSLKGFDVTWQLDGYFWPNKYAKSSLKYSISDMVSFGIFAQSDLSYNYDFGILIGIEI